MGQKRTWVMIPHWCFGVLTTALLFSAAPVWAQSQTSAPGQEVAALWADGVDQIAHGQFGEARASIARILKHRPDDAPYQQIASWLDRHGEADVVRADLHAKQREQYIRFAKKKMDKKEWGEALGYVRLAMNCSLEEAAFMREPWADQLHGEVVALARAHQESGEWAKASGLYYELKTVFEGNEKYARRFKECISHSRLEAIYGAESKWKSRLESVTPQIVQDALWLIHNKYVVEPDFRKSAKMGLERLRLLADSDALAETWPALKNTDNRGQYLHRLNRLIKKIDRQEEYSYRDLQALFERVLKINKQTIELDRELLIYEFLEGVLDEDGSLDQFTSMIWPVEFKDFEKHTQGHFDGVGIHITMRDGQITVVSPLEDTPAYRADIQADDKITHIDGQPTENLSLTGAVRTITGLAGTKVVLTIYRPRAKRSFDVELIREEIKIRSVKGYRRRADSQRWDFMLDPEFGIAYVRVTNFSDTTVPELREALREIQKTNAKGLILDLRSNPGGLLQAAIEVSEMFLQHDKMIVATNGRRQNRYSRSSRSGDKHCKLPMVVLVNEQSASASEIVSGALKDHQRAVVVGQRTFGKGSVQNLLPVGLANARLKLTTAQYYLPSGQSIHKMPGSETWGVEPDIEVQLVPRERGQIRVMNRQADVIHSEEAGPAGDDERQGEKNDEAPATDQEPREQPSEKNDEAPSADQEQAQPAAAGQDGEKTADDQQAPDAEEDGLETDDEVLEELIEYPAVDYQLETAALVLRVQLLERLGFGILPKVKLGQNTSSARLPAVVTN